MGITIASAAMDAIRTAAAASPDAEVCGLLFGSGGSIERAEPCTNVAPDRARTFEIDPSALLAAHRRERGGGPRVLGHYHSHPSGIAAPSACDRASAMGDGAVWLIVAGSEVRAWRSDRRGEFVEEAIA